MPSRQGAGWLLVCCVRTKTQRPVLFTQTVNLCVCVLSVFWIIFAFHWKSELFRSRHTPETLPWKSAAGGASAASALLLRHCWENTPRQIRVGIERAREHERESKMASRRSRHRSFMDLCQTAPIHVPHSSRSETRGEPYTYRNDVLEEASKVKY